MSRIHGTPLLGFGDFFVGAGKTGAARKAGATAPGKKVAKKASGKAIKPLKTKIAKMPTKAGAAKSMLFNAVAASRKASAAAQAAAQKSAAYLAARKSGGHRPLLPAKVTKITGDGQVVIGAAVPVTLTPKQKAAIERHNKAIGEHAAASKRAAKMAAKAKRAADAARAFVLNNAKTLKALHSGAARKGRTSIRGIAESIGVTIPTEIVGDLEDIAEEHGVEAAMEMLGEALAQVDEEPEADGEDFEDDGPVDELEILGDDFHYDGRIFMGLPPRTTGGGGGGGGFDSSPGRDGGGAADDPNQTPTNFPPGVFDDPNQPALSDVAPSDVGPADVPGTSDPGVDAPGVVKAPDGTVLYDPAKDPDVVPLPVRGQPLTKEEAGKVWPALPEGSVVFGPLRLDGLPQALPDSCLGSWNYYYGSGQTHKGNPRGVGYFINSNADGNPPWNRKDDNGKNREVTGEGMDDVWPKTGSASVTRGFGPLIGNPQDPSYAGLQFAMKEQRFFWQSDKCPAQMATEIDDAIRAGNKKIMEANAAAARAKAAQMEKDIAERKEAAAKQAAEIALSEKKAASEKKIADLQAEIESKKTDIEQRRADIETQKSTAQAQLERDKADTQAQLARLEIAKQRAAVEAEAGRALIDEARVWNKYAEANPEKAYSAMQDAVAPAGEPPAAEDDYGPAEEAPAEEDYAPEYDTEE
jgi:hypothetical protein